MGVLARLLRRSKTTEETSTPEASADSSTAEPEAEETAEAKEPPKSEAEAPDRVTEASDGEGVEIPKQQSADEAADREAGEGART